MTQTTTKPQTPAQRQRRLRYRRKHDLLLATAEVPMPVADAVMTGSAPYHRRLPNRRPSLTRTISAGNHCFEVTVGIDPANSPPHE